MSKPTLRFNDGNAKTVATAKLKQQKAFPVAALLCTDSMSLPKVLSNNTMLFTTDTRELYIGTGTGIKRVNLGSDGEIIDKTDYLTKTEAAQLYVQKDYLNPQDVITKDSLEEYVSTLSGTIDDLIRDNEYKADKEDVYTKAETNEKFIDNQEFNLGLSKKVDQEVLTNTGNHSFVKNNSTGVTLRFENVANSTESFLNVGKDDIRFYVKKTNGDMFGGRLYVTADGAFYTSTNDEDFSKHDEILTQKDLVAVQDLLTKLSDDNELTRQIAIRAQESARQSELNIENAVNMANASIEQANNSTDIANEALNVVNRIHEQLSDAYNNATSAIQQAENATDTANSSKAESADALKYVQKFETSILAQINELVRQVDELRGGGGSVPPEPGPDDPVVDKYKIIAVQAFDDVYEVPYHTEVEGLDLPNLIDVTVEPLNYLGNPLHETIGVTWLTDRFQVHQTDYSQQIVGVPTEDARITNPNHLFAIYVVRVLPEEDEVEQAPYEWSVVFAVPSYVDTIENFNTIIGHSELTSADMMGDLDIRGNYISPTVELYILGTLNEQNDNEKCYVLTDNEQQSKLNRSILDITENGFKVPILGVSSAETIANYETQTLTRAFVNANGAYQYSDGTLAFDHSVDAINVYLIRKINPNYKG